MSESLEFDAKLPPDQQAIRAKCFHPADSFVEFKKEELEQSIPKRFERIAARHANRIAIQSERCSMSYAALNRAANRTARAILNSQGESQEPVLVLLDDAAQAVMAILAALKAGKFYVPVDPSFPPERIAFMARDSETRLVITNRRQLPLANELVEGRAAVVDLDAVGNGPDDADLSLPLSPEARANIVYTSGSTGQPKGAVQTHIGILHRVKALTNTYHLCADDRMSFVHSYSVSSGMNHLFASILTGAALYPFGAKSGAGRPMADWLIREQITVYHSIPPLFRQMAATLADGETLAHLRVVSLSAAPMISNDLELYKKHCPPACALVHLLGGNEVGFISYFFMDHNSRVSSPVPVGFPMPDKEILLIDDDGRQVGYDQIGEIAVRSRYLAEGYWRRPDLTTEKFLKDPHSGGERIYLTGDIGRMSLEGCLVHIGRKDFRVKVHGFRVETAEVERTLVDHPLVEEAAVVARENRERDTRLIAYYVPVTNPAPLAGDLRLFLKERLPDYMIPSVYIALDTMPLTPNGKLDRRVLPNPDELKRNPSTPYVAPRTAVEQRLAAIWAEVLGVDPVGIHDDFFELGGHSLLASRIVGRINAAFRIDLPVRSLIDLSTVAALAALVAALAPTQKPPAPHAGDPAGEETGEL